MSQRPPDRHRRPDFARLRRRGCSTSCAGSDLRRSPVGPRARTPWATAVACRPTGGALVQGPHAGARRARHRSPRARRAASRRVLEVVAVGRRALLAADPRRRRQDPDPDRDAADLDLLEPVLAAYGDLQRRPPRACRTLLVAGALDRRSAGSASCSRPASHADQDSGGAGPGGPLTADGAATACCGARRSPGARRRRQPRWCRTASSTRTCTTATSSCATASPVAGTSGTRACASRSSRSWCCSARCRTGLGIAADAPGARPSDRAALEPWTDRASMADLARLVPRVASARDARPRARPGARSSPARHRPHARVRRRLVRLGRDLLAAAGDRTAG